MAQDFQVHNSSNLAFIKMLKDNGAKTVFSLTIHNHRLPSINDMNAVQHFQRKKLKDKEREVFDTALSSIATGKDS